MGEGKKLPEPNSLKLSTADLRMGASCHTKLWYKRHGYPYVKNLNHLLIQVGEGGYMLRNLAKKWFLDAQDYAHKSLCVDDVLDALSKSESVSIYDVTLEGNLLRSKADILVFRKTEIDVYQIVNRAFDEKLEGQVSTALKKHEDFLREPGKELALQYLILSELFEGFKIKPFFICPKKQSRFEQDDLPFLFRWDYEGTKHRIVSENRSAMKPESMLMKLPAYAIMSEYVHMQNKRSHRLYPISVSEQRPEPEIGGKCKDCPFTLSNEQFPVSGFEQCWGKPFAPYTHILELARFESLNRNENVLDTLIKKGHDTLEVVPLHIFPDEEHPGYKQLTVKKAFLKPGYQEQVKKLKYPLYFIDVEHLRTIIPYRKRDGLYASYVFMWSMHILTSADGLPTHKVWLSENPGDDEMDYFIESVGTQGSILGWGDTEKRWLLDAYALKRNESLGSAAILKQAVERYVDMQKHLATYYFHPEAAGKSGVKRLLRSVLQHSKDKRTPTLLEKEGLLKTDEQGKIVVPYALLPVADFGIIDRITDGSEAVLAYRSLIHGPALHDTSLAELTRSALLKYSMLDSLSMVIIFNEWGEMESGELKVES